MAMDIVLKKLVNIEEIINMDQIGAYSPIV